MNNEELIVKMLTQMQGDIGEMKADISGLKADVAELKTDVAELKTDVAELKTDVAELKTDVAELKTDVAELKTDVVELKTDVAEMKGDILALQQGQQRLEQQLVTMENNYGPKIISLYDAYELRGDQIERLARRVKDQMYDIRQDFGLVFSRMGNYEREFAHIYRCFKDASNI